VNALVIGFGSIGSRHARLLSELGCSTAVVSARSIVFPSVHADLAEALRQHRPEYVVIANATDKHGETLLALAQLGFAGTVLVEKPLFSRSQPIPALPFRATFVAYNMRFHPIIQRLKSLLQGQTVLSVLAYVGQYLPDWRPAVDYRTSYSASAQQGGGVLRDLSHELDYLTWMLGGWDRVSALGGQLSSLEITSEDVFALLLVTPACPVVTLQMNYLDRLSRRFVIVNTTQHTIEADLVRGTLMVDRHGESFPIDRDGTYKEMHVAALSGQPNELCGAAEGLATLRLIEAAERAATQAMWIAR